MSWETIISTVGFPIAMCIWFMVRTEKVIRNNTEVLAAFQQTVARWKR